MTTLRIGGLASGTDYASMVETLMEARQVPITTIETKQEELDYDMGAWSEVDDLAVELTTSLDTLRSYDLWRDMGVDSSDEDVATAVAATASTEQSYYLDVTQMATAQSISSDVVDVSFDLLSNPDLDISEGDIFKIEGQEITIEDGETLSSLRSKINSASEYMDDDRQVNASIVNNYLVLTRADTGSDEISLSDVSGRFLQELGVLSGVDDLTSVAVADATSDLTGYMSVGDVFEVDGEEIIVTEGETLTSLAAKITSTFEDEDEDDQIVASIVSDQLVLTRNAAGSGPIELEDTTGDALGNLGLLANQATISSDVVADPSDLSSFMSSGDEFEIAGETVTVDASETLTTLADKINDAVSELSDGNAVTASVVDDQLVLTRNSGTGSIELSDETGSILENLGILTNQATTSSNAVADATAELIMDSDASLVVGDEFEIQGVSITVEDGDTLTSLMDKINLNVTGVTASINVDNQLELVDTAGTGSITLNDVQGNALRSLGLPPIKNELVEGQDSIFTVNGLDVTRSSNKSMTDVVEGLTITLQGEGETTLEVSVDRVAVKDAINDFIEKYNELADLVDEYSTIELGASSDLAVTGELYGDTLINSMRSGLRAAATDSKSEALDASNASYEYEGLTGIMDNLSDIGVWTSSETNELSLVDEDRLDYMLENELTNVAQLFRGIYDEDEIAYQNGVAADFYRYADKLSASLTGQITVRINSLTEKYDEYGDQIDEMTDALEDYEDDLWDDFTGMEDALANAEYQTSYITAMFSS